MYYTFKSRFYDIIGQQQVQFKIEMYRKIETLYSVNFQFGHQTFKRKIETLRKFEIRKIDILLYFECIRVGRLVWLTRYWPQCY